MGTELKMSTAFRPQTDGQTERVNSVLNQYLRNYVSADQRDWVEWLGLAEFSYNKAKHSATGESPFLVAQGREPLTPADLAHTSAILPEADRVKEAEDFVAERKSVLERTRLLLEKAQSKYVKQVNKGRRQVEFTEGQKVWLNVKNFARPEGLTTKFMAKFAGPFRIVKRVFDDVYKLELPKEIKVHPTFHVSLLKPYFEDTLRPERQQVLRPQPELVGEHMEFEVEAILNSKNTRKRGKQYLVKWKGYGVNEATWEPASALKNAREAVENFETAGRPTKRRQTS
jgi:hypothetical protein